MKKLVALLALVSLLGSPLFLTSCNLVAQLDEVQENNAIWQEEQTVSPHGSSLDSCVAALRPSFPELGFLQSSESDVAIHFGPDAPPNTHGDVLLMDDGLLHFRIHGGGTREPANEVAYAKPELAKIAAVARGMC